MAELAVAGLFAFAAVYEAIALYVKRHNLHGHTLSSGIQRLLARITIKPVRIAVRVAMTAFAAFFVAHNAWELL